MLETTKSQMIELICYLQTNGFDVKALSHNSGYIVSKFVLMKRKAIGELKYDKTMNAFVLEVYNETLSATKLMSIYRQYFKDRNLPLAEMTKYIEPPLYHRSRS